MKAQRDNKRIYNIRWERMVNARPRSLCPREMNTAYLVNEAGWAPVPSWMSAENLKPTGTRYPDCPGRSESLHRLRYSRPQQNKSTGKIFPVDSRIVQPSSRFGGCREDKKTPASARNGTTISLLSSSLTSHYTEVSNLLIERSVFQKITTDNNNNNNNYRV